ncbi:hypothetical protein COW36_02995 [bacterium (Candidatus Blackallbacteria) CG17_big_fil_post_rev_8_21_14_2_50_48_46]|uniref:Uncharacterized protein n=1 Tax=bacterium (Candidatus Blackallbacteria) CG17_big_fil_post_rev_8_21_14_2_50_48_46 TaxID=2014261 RepID=A0A2M7GAC4_9BACT|nr:MAG: hypothetical protein COW64_12480 [bacterium (Candidatus Blackallbacteria) CG18_big_fil_WC_8_21_14_2_50_49_26]PIW19095.1 MAG: hypothetical protein COW36_02995 [bacterium (Candidatus Blackallbacteria) CG17_big_fil_post_rev_8_21_14_2_50_48_46]PIW44538.1 MAG: hypothetical protein COW20_23125 [bacterium (Candidatus Blackallbacteria) CG13_big_fil_rev_8_21_14_2_50_49_14]
MLENKLETLNKTGDIPMNDWLTKPPMLPPSVPSPRLTPPAKPLASDNLPAPVLEQASVEERFPSAPAEKPQDVWAALQPLGSGDPAAASEPVAVQFGQPTKAGAAAVQPVRALGTLSETEVDATLEAAFQELSPSFRGGKVKGSQIYDSVFQEKLLAQMSIPKVRQALIQKFNLNTPEMASKLALTMLLEVDGGQGSWKQGGKPGTPEGKRPILFPLGAAVLNRQLGRLLVQGTSQYQHLGHVPSQEEIKKAPAGTYSTYDGVVGNVSVTPSGPIPQTAYGQMRVGGPDSLNRLLTQWPDPKGASDEDLAKHHARRDAALAAARATGGADLANALSQIQTNAEGRFDAQLKVARELLTGQISFELPDQQFKDWEANNKPSDTISDPQNRFTVDPPLDRPAVNGKRSVNAGRFLNYAAHGDKAQVNVNETGWVRTPNHEGETTGEHKYGTYSRKMPHPFKSGTSYYTLVAIPEALIDPRK